MGDYRKLDAWKLACQLSDKVAVFVEKLPARIKATKGDQLTRAVDSIHENIAEGCGLNSDRQLAKYLRMSLGSANEAEDELLALNRRDLIDEADQGMLDDVRRLCAMLAVFIRRVDPPGHRK